MLKYCDNVTFNLADVYPHDWTYRMYQSKHLSKLSTIFEAEAGKAIYVSQCASGSYIVALCFPDLTSGFG